MTCTHPSHARKSLGHLLLKPPAEVLSACHDVPEGKATYQSSHSNTTMGESKWTWGAKLQGPLHRGTALEAAGR